MVKGEGVCAGRLPSFSCIAPSCSPESQYCINLEVCLKLLQGILQCKKSYFRAFVLNSPI